MLYAPKTHMLKPFPQVMFFGCGAFWRSLELGLGHRGEAFLVGLCPYKRRVRHGISQGVNQGKHVKTLSGRELSPRLWLCWYPDHGLLGSRTVEMLVFLTTWSMIFCQSLIFSPKLNGTVILLGKYYTWPQHQFLTLSGLHFHLRLWPCNPNNDLSLLLQKA